MAETNTPETISLEFTARAATSGHLEIEVKNGGKTLDGQLVIEVKIPRDVVSQDIRAAAERAADNDTTPNFASLLGVVTAAEGWTVWAYNDPQKKLAAIRAYNYLDKETAEAGDVSAWFEAGARLTLRIPLIKKDVRAQITIPHSYQYGGRQNKPVIGSVDFVTAGAGECKPQVSLTTDHQSPTNILPGRKVKIFWEAKNAVSAVLRGPLPGGHSELRLSKNKGSDFWMEKGSLEIYAVGAATYMLDAEVCGPEGQPNVQVVKTLMLDVYTADKYSSLIVRPSRVLPNGEVELDWAVWGVEKATIEVENRLKLTLNLTEQDLSRSTQGTGIWRINAINIKEDVKLEITNDPEHKAWKEAKINVAQWGATEKRGFTGKPIGLAVAVPKMALLTTDGLWLTTVGKDDSDRTALNDKVFRKVSKDAPKARLALTAFDNGYVVLQQTAEDGLQLARYKNDGTQQVGPVDLSDAVKPIVRTPDTIFDLAAFGNRVYVVAQSPGGGGRRSYSVRFDVQELPRTEHWLERLAHYRLLTFNGGLYAIHRSSGQMLRFDLTEKGELDRPRKAASASYNGQSLVRKGLLVPVGLLLAVLEPEPFQEFREMRLCDSTNVPECVLKEEGEEKVLEDIPQDLVYNPQKNEWSPCGHGLDIKPGAVAAYRGGDSERLWVLQPDGEMQTLTGASEDRFAQDYVEKFPSEPLPPALDGKLEFTLVNQSGINLIPVDNECRAAGLDNISVTSVAELEPLPDRLSQGDQKKFTLSFNKDEPGVVWLRFMVEGSSSPRYLLELTFSGSGMKSISSTFKRLAVNGQVADIPESTEQHSADRPIVVTRTGQLTYKTTLFLLNAAPYYLGLNPEVGIRTFDDKAEIKINYTTPSFTINVPEIPKVGSLGLTFDFAMPPGIEMSPSGEAQRRLVRITNDSIHMLNLYIQALTASPAPIVFQVYDGTAVTIPGPHNDTVVCQIGVKTRKELDGVRLGDAVAINKGWHLLIPLAKPQGLPNAAISKVAAGAFHSFREVKIDAQGGVFSMPNSVTASNDKIYGVFGDTTVQENDTELQGNWKKESLTGYKQIIALAAAANGDLFMVATKDKYVDYQLTAGYFLVRKRASGKQVELSLDRHLSFPVVGPPLAVSPDGKTVAICQQGGLLVVDVRHEELKSEHVNPVRLASAREPAYVTFTHDGYWIYCAHMTRAIGFNPRRTVAGRDLTVSRVRGDNLRDTLTTPLPNVESNFGLTGNTKQSFGVATQSKEEVAFTLAVSPDNTGLFVSAGAEILKINTSSFTLMQWRATVELPSRLSHVTEARGNAWTVHALGSNYVGNGTTVDQYKTHLYAIPAPKR